MVVFYKTSLYVQKFSSCFDYILSKSFSDGSKSLNLVKTYRIIYIS